MDILQKYKSKKVLIEKLETYMSKHKNTKISLDLGLDIYNIKGLTYSHENELLGFGNTKPINCNIITNNSETKKIYLKHISSFREEILNKEELIKESGVLLNTPFIEVYKDPFILRLDKAFYMIIVFSSNKGQYFSKFTLGTN